MQAASEGDSAAAASLDRYVDRLGRGLAVIADILDPDVIVLGGGLSNVAALYERLPGAMAPHVFSDAFETPIRPRRATGTPRAYAAPPGCGSLRTLAAP